MLHFNSYGEIWILPDDSVVKTEVQQLLGWVQEQGRADCSAGCSAACGSLGLRMTSWRWSLATLLLLHHLPSPAKEVMELGSPKMPEEEVKSWFNSFWRSLISWQLFATTSQICFIKSGCVPLCYKFSYRCWVELKGDEKPQQECGTSSWGQFSLRVVLNSSCGWAQILWTSPVSRSQLLS